MYDIALNTRIFVSYFMTVYALFYGNMFLYLRTNTRLGDFTINNPP